MVHIVNIHFGKFSPTLRSAIGLNFAREGKYYIGMYAFKNIAYGEELTFDYCSMTESQYEHSRSVCLCGMKKCRGFYLQLSNTKMFNNLMDSKNCFYARNSAILRAN